MEKQINKIIENYIVTMKDNIKNKIIESFNNKSNDLNEILEYITEYERLVINKDDIIKTQKQNIKDEERCIAKLQNGEQCTRKKKKNDYCGTHLKREDIEPTKKMIEVSTIEIKGIIYYKDLQDNIYNTEEVLAGKENPTIIGKLLPQENIEYYDSLFS